jgi:peptide/nickel transport system permease protein/oligopeptide transport system permease protein
MSITEPGQTGTAGAASAGGAIAAITEPGVADIRAARPLRKDVWRHFRKNKLAMVGLVFIVLIVLAAIFAPLIAPYGITERTSEFRSPPSMDHLFGTDRIGRDVFSRVIYGARVSLRVGILSTVISLIIGVVLGAMAGFFGRALETVIMRITDIFLAIPYIILAIALATVLGRGENTVIIVLGVTGWLAICRIVRSSFLSLKQLEYVEAATAIGAGRLRIMFRHILPNALQPIIVYGTIAVGSAILAEAALSFLGVGAVEPTPAWGLMVDEGRGDLVNAPHLLFFPGAAIFLTVLAFQFVGDGLRDALDPRLR